MLIINPKYFVYILFTLILKFFTKIICICLLKNYSEIWRIKLNYENYIIGVYTYTIGNYFASI